MMMPPPRAGPNPDGQIRWQSARNRPRNAAARRRNPASVAAGELLTLLDFVRYAVSRFVEAKLVFAHGTTDPVAEAAFLVCETLHLHPDQFETFATARVTAAEGQTDSRRDRAPHLDAKARGLSRQQDLHARPAVLCRRAHDRAALLHRRIAGLAFRRRRTTDDGGALIDDPASVESVLDLCTGSGCLAILASRNFPECADRRGGHFQGRPRCRRAQCCRLRS